MFPLSSQMSLYLIQGQKEKALSTAEEIIRGLDPDDDDDMHILRETIKEGLGSPFADAFLTLLREQGFDFSMNWMDQGGILLAFAQSGSRSLPVFQKLLELGADPYTTNREGCTILHFFARREKSPWDEESGPFAAGMVSAMDDIAPWLEPDVYGATPLHMACLQGHVEILHALLKKGAPPDLYGTQSCGGFFHSVCFDQVTPLQLACQNGDLECAGLLLEYGADAAKADGHGRTAPFYAVDTPREHYCRIYYSSIPGAQAVQEKKRRILELLGPVDTADEAGRTPLLHALAGSFLDTGGYGIRLLELGADPEHADNAGRTPLMEAARNTHKETVKKLVSLGVDLNRQDRDGNTALHFALSKAYDQKSARYLIKKGADARIVNNAGKSALDLAAQGGMNDILQLILG